MNKPLKKMNNAVLTLPISGKKSPPRGAKSPRQTTNKKKSTIDYSCEITISHSSSVVREPKSARLKSSTTPMKKSANKKTKRAAPPFIPNPETKAKLLELQKDLAPSRTAILTELKQVELEREQHLKEEDQNIPDNNKGKYAYIHEQE